MTTFTLKMSKRKFSYVQVRNPWKRQQHSLRALSVVITTTSFSSTKILRNLIFSRTLRYSIDSLIKPIYDNTRRKQARILWLLLQVEFSIKELATQEEKRKELILAIKLVIQHPWLAHSQITLRSKTKKL